MNKIVKIAAIAGVSLIVLLGVAAVVIITVIDPNDYKPQIENAALEATGKKLQLQGKLSLSLFPSISIEAGPALMEDDASFGSDPFLRVEKVSASVALMPLFSGKAEIGAVEVSGARLKLAVNKNGENNWSMPAKTQPAQQAATQPGTQPGAQPGKSPLGAIALDSLSITNATVVYVDMPAKADITLTVKKLELKNVKVGEKSTLNVDAKLAGVFADPADMALSASFTLPATLGEGTQVTAEGTFAKTPFSFQGFVALPKGLTLKGNASFGAVDLDKFMLPAKKGGQTGESKRAQTSATVTEASTAASDKALAETLRDLVLDVHVKAESVTVKNIPLKKIEATIKADQGLIAAKPVSLDAFGPLTAEASLDARGPAIKTRTSGEWKNVAVGPLAKAASGKAPLTATLDASWNVGMTGLSWPAAAKTLNGKAAMHMKDGHVPGFHLIPSGLPGLPAMTLDISNMTCASTWNITNGIAANNDMTVRATALSGTGAGSVDIPAERIDYKMSLNVPTIKELPDLKVLPVEISGPLASPSYGIDQPAVLRQTVKSVLDPSTKVGSEVGKALKKLF